MKTGAGGRFPAGVFAAAALLLSACAQLEAPPGGPEDRFPPYVIETIPDTFSVIEPGQREIFIRFSERISESTAAGPLSAAVIVSPPAGEVRARHRRDGISIRLGEDLREDEVYRITLLPIINDMFSNSLRDPFDLILSTGAEFTPNVVAGMVEDRVTGRAVGGVLVEARFPRGDDSITHWNVSDSEGFFSLRYVPPGPYELRAAEDQNRDREVGEREPQTGFNPGELAGPADTSFTILSVIAPDTTPPVLLRVNIADSVTLRFEFDDYLEPEVSGDAYSGLLVRVPVEDTAGAGADSVQAVDTLGVEPGAEEEVAAEGAEAPAEAVEDTVPPIEIRDTIQVRFFLEYEYERWEAARRDSTERAEAEAGDTVGGAGEEPDSAQEAEERDPAGAAGAVGAVEADAPEAAEPGDPAGDEAAAADSVEVPRGLSGLILPTRTIVGVLDGPLPPEIPYEAIVTGAVSIAGTVGGGGRDTVMAEPPPPPEDTVPEDNVATDTTGAATDTTDAAGDTLEPPGTPPDTLTPPDTVTPPDTLATPAISGSVRPFGGGHGRQARRSAAAVSRPPPRTRRRPRPANHGR